MATASRICFSSRKMSRFGAIREASSSPAMNGRDRWCCRFPAPETQDLRIAGKIDSIDRSTEPLEDGLNQFLVVAQDAPQSLFRSFALDTYIITEVCFGQVV